MTERKFFAKKFKIQKYSLVEFLKYTEDKYEHFELINGRIYAMASPNVIHQDIASFISRKLGNYLEGKKCRAFIAPLDVVLFKKDEKKSQNVFQPDVFVICDPDKISKERIYGAPDFVAEIVSPASIDNDYNQKLGLYMEYGVKEYWIVDPESKKIFVKINGQDEILEYSSGDRIKVGIFDDFYIDFKELQFNMEEKQNGEKS